MSFVLLSCAGVLFLFASGEFQLCISLGLLSFLILVLFTMFILELRKLLKIFCVLHSFHIAFVSGSAKQHSSKTTAYVE